MIKTDQKLIGINVPIQFSFLFTSISFANNLPIMLTPRSEVQ